jgi:hypothetical protein
VGDGLAAIAPVAPLLITPEGEKDVIKLITGDAPVAVKVSVGALGGPLNAIPVPAVMDTIPVFAMVGVCPPVLANPGATTLTDKTPVFVIVGILEPPTDTPVPPLTDKTPVFAIVGLFPPVELNPVPTPNDKTPVFSNLGLVAVPVLVMPGPAVADRIPVLLMTGRVGVPPIAIPAPAVIPITPDVAGARISQSEGARDGAAPPNVEIFKAI